MQKGFKQLSPSKSGLPSFKLPIDTSKKHKKFEIHGKVSVEGDYIENTDAPSSYNGIFSKVDFAPTLRLFGLPFTGDASLCLQNGQVRWDYSNFNFQFDCDKYQSELKNNYQKYIQDMNHFFPPSEAEKVSGMDDSLKRMDQCQKTVSSPGYYQLMKKLIAQSKRMQDSLSHPRKDSCGYPIVDSAAIKRHRAVNDSINHLKKYQQDFDNIQKYVSANKKLYEELLQYKSFLEKVKNAASLSEILAGVPSRSPLSGGSPANAPEQIASMDATVKRYDDFGKIVNDPGFKPLVKQLSSTAKSLKDSIDHPPLDSCGYPVVDSTKIRRYKMLNDSVSHMHKSESEYNNLHKYINDHSQLYQKLQEYRSYDQKIKGAANPSTELSKLENKSGLNKKPKFFGSIQKLAIGRVNINYSPLTIYNQSIFGVNVEYLINNRFYVGGGIGVPAAFNFGFAPSILTHPGSMLQNANRYLAFLKAGIGTEKGNHIYLIYLTYAQKFSNTAVFFPNMAPANSVLALEVQQNVLKKIKVTAEAALSNTSYFSRSASFEPFSFAKNNMAFNFAFRTSAEGTVKKTQTTITVKAEAISGNFATSGNPFLRNGLIDYGLTLKQLLLKNKLTLTNTTEHQILGFQQPGLTSENLTNTLAANLSVNKNVNLSATYIFAKQLPTTFETFPTNFSLHTVSFMQQYFEKLGKLRTSTIFTSVLSYSGNSNPEFSTASLSIQNGAKQVFNLGKGITFQPGGGCILANSFGALDNFHVGYWVEAGNTFNFKAKVLIQYSAKYIINPVMGNNANANASISIKIYKKLQFLSKGVFTFYKTAYGDFTNTYWTASGGLNYTW